MERPRACDTPTLRAAGPSRRDRPCTDGRKAATEKTADHEALPGDEAGGAGGWSEAWFGSSKYFACSLMSRLDEAMPYGNQRQFRLVGHIELLFDVVEMGAGGGC